MTAPLKRGGLIAEEELPRAPQSTSDDAARRLRARHRLGPPRIVLLRDRAPTTRDGVLDSDFRVHGTSGLRVVDASVFPRIPGFFIASAVYMVAEKAADVILRDAGGTGL